MISCDVCGRPADLMSPSILEPIMLRLCEECSEHAREPWELLEEAFDGLEIGNLAPGVLSTLEASCAFYGKSKEGLFNGQ